MVMLLDEASEFFRLKSSASESRWNYGGRLQAVVRFMVSHVASRRAMILAPLQHVGIRVVDDRCQLLQRSLLKDFHECPVKNREQENRGAFQLVLSRGLARWGAEAGDKPSPSGWSTPVFTANRALA
jgi:hypothetical protein